jgi:hypothetical protein
LGAVFPPAVAGTLGSDAGHTTDASVPDASCEDAATKADAGGECLDDPVLEHACIHVERGPFGAVTASTGASVADVNAPHTYFTVTLPAGGQTGRLAYQPPRTARFVLYLGDGAEVSMRTPAQTLLPPAYSEAVDGTAVSANCTALKRAQVYSLSQDTVYSLELTPIGASTSTTLLFEDFDSFTGLPWPQRFEPCEE